MSGIFGLILKNSSSPARKAADFEKILDSLKHRGPDARNLHIEESAVLGACLLSRRENEIQPLSQPGLGLSVVFDGRLDRRARLIEGLREAGLGLESPDQALVLTAFRKWGVNTAERLRGDFAFAVWDKTSRRLFLARDIFGVKPLYYYEDAEKFCFASEALPLCALAGISPEPDPDTAIDLILGENRGRSRTFFKNIRQVPPGNFLVLPPEGSAKIQSYWQPPQNLLRMDNPRDYEEKFFSLFRQSVEDRMRASSPIGICLSGGLDSLQAASMAADLRLEKPDLPRLEPVTWLFYGFLQSDRQALRDFEARYGLATDFFQLEEETVARSNMEFFNHTGESPAPDVLTTQPALFRRLKEKGCKTVWTGFGGNELSFYPAAGHLQDLMAGLRLPSLLRETWKAAENFGRPRVDVLRWIFTETVVSSLPAGLAARHKKRRLEFFRNRLLAPFRQAVEQAAAPERFYKDLSREHCRRQIMDPWFCFGLAQMDHAAARQSMEVTHPFLDRDLVEFLLQIPGEEHVRHGYRKMFFQKALEPVVAGPLREKDDDSDLEPDADRVYSAAFQRERLKFYLSSPESFIYTYIRYGDLKKLLDDEKGYWRHHAWLWRLARLECWAQKNLTVKTQEAVHERHHCGLSAS